eukprot:scaffold212209_cov30-Tisochrysis_lutea.AAC.3
MDSLPATSSYTRDHQRMDEITWMGGCQMPCNAMRLCNRHQVEARAGGGRANRNQIILALWIKP